MTSTPEPSAKLRSDAQANYERILAAATEVIDRDGPDAPLTTIAAEAEVGIGTLYRRFPTREDLIEAVYRHRIITLCDSTTDILAAELTPHAALHTWMARYVDLLIINRAVPDAIRHLLASNSEFRNETKNNLGDAIEVFLNAGRQTRTIRQDVHSLDILRALTGIAYISQSRSHAQHPIMLIADGLRPRAEDDGAPGS
ncbi:TetR/AcrR family transcriptional regulator [Gordonia zhaorongruii]|uniref:TetR/AcrR family transcriptional regulator n=1 Tax=Gordonia zhaorongruii TaxID=2597659 RepID=UPI0011806970|nr:TetR/AcrR family transcriptional regulator [Gordonia zhaorongruii]